VPGRGDRGHRTVPHTADVRIEAWGPSREACFAEAVRGLVQSFADTAEHGSTTPHECRLAADSDEELLVAVLDEVIYRLDARGEIPAAVEVQPAGDGVLVRFAMTDARAVRPVGAVPKAVSLHELRVARGPDGWACSVTVDV
jgi:SHS2 domain-containing protein